MNSFLLLTKLEMLPSNVQTEVFHFMEYLIGKNTNSKKRIKSKFGSVKGKIRMAADFDDTL